MLSVLTWELWGNVGPCSLQGVCTEAGMYALRERRVHVTQEDFEMAVAKVSAAEQLLAAPSQLWEAETPGQCLGGLGAEQELKGCSVQEAAFPRGRMKALEPSSCRAGGCF